MMHKVSQLSLVWTNKSVAAPHCVPWFQTQVTLNMCHIRHHNDLWGRCSIG